MQHISPQEFAEVLETPSVGALCINVCSPDEYQAMRIEGVKNIPLPDLLHHLEELRAARTVYIHCMSGGRSQRAIALLAEQGLSAELINVSGGLMGWLAAGLPIKTGANG